MPIVDRFLRCRFSVRTGLNIVNMSVKHELSRSPGNLSLMNPGAILIEILDMYDRRLGDPAIHYFQVVKRRGARVKIAGIAKESIPGKQDAPDFRKRVRPLEDAFVRGCKICRDAERREYRRCGRSWSRLSAISAARWFAHDGTGPHHDASSSEFQHAFSDYIPTVTMLVYFHDGEPYLVSDPASGVLLRVAEPANIVSSSVTGTYRAIIEAEYENDEDLWSDAHR